MRGTWSGGRWTVLVLVVGVAVVAAGVLLGLRPVSADGVDCGTVKSPIETTPTFDLSETPCESALSRQLGWAALLVLFGGTAVLLAAFVMMVSRPEAIVSTPEEAAAVRRRLWRRAWGGAALVVLLVGAAGFLSTREVAVDGVECGSVFFGEPEGAVPPDESTRAACDDEISTLGAATYGFMASGVLVFVVTSYFVMRIESPETAEAGFRMGH